MESRQGRISQQLTQWIGGTIILIMGIFVLLDLGLQTRFFRRYHTDVVTQGVDGLRAFIQGRADLDEALENLYDASACFAYIEGRHRGFILFDLEGKPLYSTPLAQSADVDETLSLFVLPDSPEIPVFRAKVAGTSLVAAAARFTARGGQKTEGVAVYLLNVTSHRQVAMFLWGWRSAIILIIIVGVMFAVRIPVRKFVIRPMDGLFVAAYAASKDDFRQMPKCTSNNEFVDLYEMFDRMMHHLSDTRIFEATLLDDDDAPPLDDVDLPSGNEPPLE